MMQRLALPCLLLLAPVACSQVLIRQLLQLAKLQTCRSNSSSRVMRVLLRKAVSLMQQSLAVVFLLVLVQLQPTVCSLLAGLMHHLEHLHLQGSSLQTQLAAVASVQCLMLRELSTATQLLQQTLALVYRQQGPLLVSPQARQAAAWQVPHNIQLQGRQASALELQRAWLQAVVSRLQQHSLLGSASVSLLAVLLDSSVLHQVVLLSPAAGQQRGLKARALPLGCRHPVQQVPPLQQTLGWGRQSVHLQDSWGQGQHTLHRLRRALLLQVVSASKHSALQLTALQLRQGPHQGGWPWQASTTQTLRLALQWAWQEVWGQHRLQAFPAAAQQGRAVPLTQLSA
jgi:hypothetical protein